jgi:hypothetical protein
MGKNKSTKSDGINPSENTQQLEDNKRRISKGVNRKNASSPK